MFDPSRLSPSVKRDILEYISENNPDITDAEATLAALDAEHVFELWCHWEGFIGWAERLHNVHEEIFGNSDYERKKTR
jgi:hypothetical protein